MARTTLQVLFVAAIAVCYQLRLGSAQTIVDSSICQVRNINCPLQHNKDYETFCCVQSDGRQHLLYCCNPYVGLFIGLGVGIPFLLGLVILVILLYCCWSRYHRKRMTILTEMYIQQVAAASASDDAQNNGAPPGYTAVDASKAETNLRLPIYTEDDPFPDSINPPPDYTNENKDEESQSIDSASDNQPLIV